MTASKVQLRQSKSSYQLLGTVTPSRMTTIGCALAGRVDILHVKRGDHLAKGEDIANLKTEVIKIEIAAAKAEHRLAQQQLAELQAGSRSEDVEEARARMEAAAAISRRSESQMKRIKRLIASNAASADEVDVAIADADSSEQLYRAAKVAYDRTVAGPRLEQIAQAQASVDLQGERVRLLEDRLQKHTVVAPFDGYVTAEHTEAGAWVVAGDPVIDMIELDTVLVEVAVPVSQIIALRQGQSIRVECPERPGELLLATLERIVPSADTRSRTFPILLRIENRTVDGIPILMSGMVVRIDLPVGPETQSLFVPTDSIVLDRTKHSVFVVDVDGQAGMLTGAVRRVPVELGIADGELIAVTGDLQAGEWVVTRGNERLAIGQSVSFAAEVE
ncbi:efflux RND transporter periplasmic adaptor subunit [Stieleria varia]|uniref:efflux RND transporter periplasmic adaptor subunit n=1 Tax=Stieleria varia TaxID=2528005 RepID=UPI0018D244A4|nr:efflux RND transporter periplasmic adaptor subunit [Stieleria varia]